MSSGYQANGDKWVGFEDCDKHIATEGAACPICAVEALQAKVEELEAEIVTLRNFAHGIKQTVELMLMNPSQEGE